MGTNETKMPEWPKLAEFVTPTPYGESMTTAQMADFELARAEAAIARLRVAEAALSFISDSKFAHPPETLINEASKALYLIGEVPE